MTEGDEMEQEARRRYPDDDPLQIAFMQGANYGLEVGLRAMRSVVTP